MYKNERTIRETLTKLYKENVGPVVPLLEKDFREFSLNYQGPLSWLPEAFVVAISQGRPTWAYIKGILCNWQDEGHQREEPRRESKSRRGLETPAGSFKPKPKPIEYEDEELTTKQKYPIKDYGEDEPVRKPEAGSHGAWNVRRSGEDNPGADPGSTGKTSSW